ncbi:hypothetical protein [Halapricum salinum]|uniref:Uncharacterized protein n=1 Tax=Halapricum salinum TaxID=1457250 RepID=A0A4D6HBW7_9EURY|nr:hypothetical protein [Halapricum salinum]QCC51021.1 hypothetical protein DV733_07085 [Halapricum salinum]
MADSEYQAGVCNIGGTERTRRWQMGFASFAVAVLYVAVVLWFGLPVTYLLGTFVFLYGGALGVLQAQKGFCAAYGMSGRYGFDDGSGSVEDTAALASDRKRSLLIIAQASAAALLGTSLLYGAVLSL